MAEHVLDMMHRPARLQESGTGFMAQIMEVQINGPIGCLRLGTQFRRALVVWSLFSRPNPDGLVAVCPQDCSLPGSPDTPHTATDLIAEDMSRRRERCAVGTVASHL